MNGSVGYIFQRCLSKTVFTRLMDRVNRFEVISWSLKYCFFRKCSSWIQTYTAKNRSQIKQCPPLTSNTSTSLRWNNPATFAATNK